MAFQNKNLSVIAYANGWTLWLYRSAEDKAETICSDGYFNKINDLCNDGDMILITPSDGGALTRVILKEDEEVILTKIKD